MIESIWKPHTTVAALCERDGKYLLVKERIDEQIVYNQPAGHLEAGDVIPMGYGPDWPVGAVDPYRSLVLDIEEPGVRISWSFGLYELDDEQTRLVLRMRIHLSLVAHLLSFFPVMDFGQFLMTRKMLLGIKERAEARA